MMFSIQIAHWQITHSSSSSHLNRIWIMNSSFRTHYARHNKPIKRRCIDTQNLTEKQQQQPPSENIVISRSTLALFVHRCHHRSDSSGKDFSRRNAAIGIHLRCHSFKAITYKDPLVDPSPTKWWYCDAIHSKQLDSFCFRFTKKMRNFQKKK